MTNPATSATQLATTTATRRDPPIRPVPTAIPPSPPNVATNTDARKIHPMFSDVYAILCRSAHQVGVSGCAGRGGSEEWSGNHPTGNHPTGDHPGGRGADMTTRRADAPTDQELRFFGSPGPPTALPADPPVLARLPRTAEELCRVSSGLIVHEIAAQRYTDRYGTGDAEGRLDGVGTRSVGEVGA